MEKLGLGGLFLVYVFCTLGGGCTGPYIFHFNKFLAVGAGLLLGEIVGVIVVSLLILLVVIFFTAIHNFR